MEYYSVSEAIENLAERRERSRPLKAQKQTCPVPCPKSAEGQYATSFDRFVRPQNKGRRNLTADDFGRLKIQNELVFRRFPLPFPATGTWPASSRSSVASRMVRHPHRMTQSLELA